MQSLVNTGLTESIFDNKTVSNYWDYIYIFLGYESKAHKKCRIENSSVVERLFLADCSRESLNFC